MTMFEWRRKIEERVQTLESQMLDMQSRVAERLITSQELKEDLMEAMAPVHERLAQQDMALGEIHAMLVNLVNAKTDADAKS